MASQTTEHVAAESLTVVEERAARSDGFALRGADETPIKHAALDDPAATTHQPGRSYSGDAGGGGSLPGLKLNRLLRLLVSKPGFSESFTSLSLANGTSATIREYCVPMSRVDLSFRWRERVYWGTIRYAKAADGGAWLNTGSRTEPSIRIENELLGRILDYWELDGVEDLAGAAFAFWGKARPGRKTPDKLFLFVSSLTTFVTIPDDRIVA